MSATRDLIARLRRRLGEDKPLAAAMPATVLTPPPRRVFPTVKRQSEFARGASVHTTALVGIGHVGTRYSTDVALQFQAELAVAHSAVASSLPADWRTQHELLPIETQARDHQEYLLRPDLGRRLANESHARLERDALKDVDVQPILADGLSAQACVESGLEVLQVLTSECERRGWSVGTPMCARHARVWLEDEIGAVVRAKISVIILGERPGLGTGDGLSAYMVYSPAIGKTDGDRNMISNIHERGISPVSAARRLAGLAGAMLEQEVSGVRLDLSKLQGEMTSTMLRAPQVRKPLVETDR